MVTQSVYHPDIWHIWHLPVINCCTRAPSNSSLRKIPNKRGDNGEPCGIPLFPKNWLLYRYYRGCPSWANQRSSAWTSYPPRICGELSAIGCARQKENSGLCPAELDNPYLSIVRLHKVYENFLSPPSWTKNHIFLSERCPPKYGSFTYALLDDQLAMVFLILACLLILAS